MSRVIYTWLNLIWGLWFGGLTMLFLSVQWVFKALENDRPSAGLAATTIFHQFNRYRLFLAAAALLVVAVTWLAERRRLNFALFMLIAAAGLAAVYSTGIIAPRLELMRVNGDIHSERFRQLHGLSMAVYLAEAVIVLAVGVVMPAARRTAPRLTP